MKRYENPMLNISLFDAENVVTDGSQPTPPAENTAVDMAMSEAATITSEANTFSVIF